MFSAATALRAQASIYPHARLINLLNVFFTSYTLLFVVKCIAFFETFTMIFFILHIHAGALTFAGPCPLYEQLLSYSALPRCVAGYYRGPATGRIFIVFFIHIFNIYWNSCEKKRLKPLFWNFLYLLPKCTFIAFFIYIFNIYWISREKKSSG